VRGFDRTILPGTVTDQYAQQGLLKKVHDQGKGPNSAAKIERNEVDKQQAQSKKGGMK
jgi:hypothetical protein